MPVKAAAKLDANHCGTLPGERPAGPVELKLASLGPVQPLVVGHYSEMGGYVEFCQPRRVRLLALAIAHHTGCGGDSLPPSLSGSRSTPPEAPLTFA